MADPINEERLRDMPAVQDRKLWRVHVQRLARQLLAARAELERLRDMLALLCAAVDYSALRYGVDEDWADLDTLRLRMDEAKALLARHKETNP